MENIEIQIVEYNSDLQKKSLEVRYKVLREPLGLQYTPQQLADEKEEIHIVALEENTVLGVLVLKKEDSKILKMRQVAVEATHQHSGIGKQLVLFSEQYAKEHSFSIIELHARETAKYFYLRLNYHIVGNLFIEVGIPHYRMKKVLK